MRTWNSNPSPNASCSTGEMGSTWGVNRTVAQIHALLFIAGRPTERRRHHRNTGRGALQREHEPSGLSNWNLVKTVHMLATAASISRRSPMCGNCSAR